MNNIKKDRKYFPTKTSGDYIIESDFEDLKSSILGVEDFKETEKGVFQYTGEALFTLPANKSKTRNFREKFYQITLKIIEQQDKCLLQTTLVRKKGI